MANLPRIDNANWDPAGPAQAAVAVTPSDVANLPDGACKFLWVGTAGALSGIDAEGNTVTNFPALAGYNPISMLRINSTGLTAANIWAMY